ncbi:MAG: PaaI family thioesterase [Acidimicrobiales bacterium]
MTDTTDGSDPAEVDLELVMSEVASRWQETPPEQMTERRVAMRSVADSMRSIIDRLVATAAPTELIVEMVDQLASIAGQLESWPHGTLYEGFAEAANAGSDPHAMFEHSPFIGRANPLAPPIVLAEVDGHLDGRVRFGSAYEGPPGCVHGGYIAGAFDELLGATQSLSGNPGMTARLTVNYRSPTPLRSDLRMRGELTRVEGRKIFTNGWLYCTEADGSERLCSEAEGLFISMDFGRFAAMKNQREEAERNRLEATGD